MNALAEVAPWVRKAVFAVVATLLVALAFVATRGPGHPQAAAPSAAATDNSTVVVTKPMNTGSGAASEGPTTPGTTAGTLVPQPLGTSDLLQTQNLAARFLAAFTTYRYDQDDRAVTANLTAMLDKNPALNLTGVIPTGSLKAALVADRYSTTSVVTVRRAVTVATALVAYDVDATVTTHRAGVTTTKTTAYVVTLTRMAGWGINDVQVATATGDGPLG